MNTPVIPHHDAQPGPLRRCQITDSEELYLVLDLGVQPLCDGLLLTPDVPVVHYPLALWHCPESGLAQLDYVVDGGEVFPPAYPYRSGISKPLADYQRAFADGVAAQKFTTLPNPLVVDVGSNDGTLLTGFKAHGYRALGVEPTDVAQIAMEENGIYTLQDYFTTDVAKDIVVDHGRAQLVTMTNVFAHIAPLGEIMRALDVLLARDGVFITESHYLLDILLHNQFDTIYHEHIRTYSVKALCILVEQYGMEVFDVERGSRYGGNIRAYVCRRGQFPVSEGVAQLRKHEDDVGLHDPYVWTKFRDRVLALRDSTMELLYQLHAQGATIAGCSAPGRATTLLNFYGIRPDTVPYLAELPNSLKLGKWVPGCQIPIVENSILPRAQPDYIILFAWHYAEEIKARLRREGVRARFIQPLPNLSVSSGVQP